MKIRLAENKDIFEMYTLDNLVWGDDMCASPEKFLSRIEKFTEGQVVAEYDGKIYGLMNAQRVTGKQLEKLYRRDAGTWHGTTDNGFITKTHQPDGEILFLINLTVQPAVSDDTGYRRKEIATKLSDHMKDLAERNGLTRRGLTRVNGFRNYLQSIEEGYSEMEAYIQIEMQKSHIHRYIAEVVDGAVTDPSLSFHLSQGARIIGPVENAMAGDWDSELMGALFVYE